MLERRPETLVPADFASANFASGDEAASGVGNGVADVEVPGTGVDVATCAFTIAGTNIAASIESTNLAVTALG